jgi:CRP-like cAMP-binding protein
MAAVQVVAVPFLSFRIARRLHPMARKKKRKAKRGKGATTDREVRVRLAPTLELIHEHITEALCDEVFSGVVPHHGAPA